MLRLHYAGFTQGSFFVRNILTQPGPLSASPEERSSSTPSFRIIDFGRGQYWNETSENEDKNSTDYTERVKGDWAMEVREEDRRAQRELQIPDWNF
jgi:hypothetical protein